jgi:hypothetical protein
VGAALVCAVAVLALSSTTAAAADLHAEVEGLSSDAGVVVFGD